MLRGSCAAARDLHAATDAAAAAGAVLQVRTRLESEQGISFTEFTYQLLQGYDFVHLCKEHGVRVQVSAGSWCWAGAEQRDRSL